MKTNENQISTYAHLCSCGEPKSKRELMRVALSPEGTISIDRTGKAPGRGAYICASMDCFEAAYKG